MDINIDNLEYSRLTKRLEFYDATRNTLLTFSFTSVLTVLGIALQMDMDMQTSWICLIPYFLIIPFSARISYYRISSAHISSFLRIFAKDKMQFEIGAKDVPEGKGVRYSFIAWLVNHEMVLLGAASSTIFYFKYIPEVMTWNFGAHLGALVPVLLLCIVFIITDTSYNWGDMISKNSICWKKIARATNGDDCQS